MKQLYYTSCQTGKSLGGSSGFQVRAASADVPGDQLRAAVAYVGYSLPVTVMPSEKTAATAPVRLALLNTRDAGRLLCHSAYVGKDPMTGRFGNFFSHALLDVPPDVDASRAIQTWGSKFWRRCDDDGDTKLDEVQELPPHGFVKEKLTSFLAAEPNRQMLWFALQALLMGGESVRLFIAASAEDVALCVYGVTRALPRSMMGDLTFSTYETDPLTCNARLVGTWWGDTPEMDLPSSCYSGTYIGYNSYNGRKTELTGSSRYAEFAVKALAAEQDEKIDEFRKVCERLQVDQADLLDLVYRLHTREGAERISSEECQRLLQHPPLADWIVGHAKFAGPILEKINSHAKEDSEYHQVVAPLVVEALATRPDRLDQLSGLSQDARARLSSWLFLHSFLDQPSFTPPDLERVADGLKLQPKEARRRTLNRIVEVVTEKLMDRGADPRVDVQPDLENFLLFVGPSIPKGPAGLFIIIRRRLSDGGVDYWKKLSTFLPALFAVALGGSRYDNLSFSQFGNRLKDEVQDMVNEARRRGGRRILRMIDGKSQAWARTKARSRWEELTAKLINRHPWRRALKYLLILLVAGTCLLVVEEWRLNRFGLRDWVVRWVNSAGGEKQNEKGDPNVPRKVPKGDPPAAQSRPKP